MIDTDQSEGLTNTAIAERVGVSRPTVIAWRDRYQAKGIDGLADEPGPAAPARSIGRIDTGRVAEAVSSGAV